MPILCLSTIYNIPKFFELEVADIDSGNTRNITEDVVDSEDMFDHFINQTKEEENTTHLTMVSFSRSIGSRLPVDHRSGGRLAMTLVGTNSCIILLPS